MPKSAPKGRVATYQEKAKASAQAYWQRVRQPVLRVVLTPWFWFKKVCFTIGAFVVVALFFTGLYVTWFLRSLPDIQNMSFQTLQEIGKKRVHQRLENKKARYRWTEIKDINREFLYSVVLSEDSTFFEHEGFNFEMMVSSFAENLKEGRRVYGASTISQQVAKNLFLSNEKTYARKVREFIITQRLERKFTKNELLEIYLNIAEFGPDIYGVEPAAKHYFNRAPSSINAAEGAFIALMLPSPKRNYFSIFQNRNLPRTKVRRVERVLRDMLYEEYLSEAQYRKYARYRYFSDAIPRETSSKMRDR